MTVVERLVACHHPSLAEGNKQKLQVGDSITLHDCSAAGKFDSDSNIEHKNVIRSCSMWIFLLTLIKSRFVWVGGW